MKRIIPYLATLAALAALSAFAGFPPRQVASIAVFLAVVLGAIFFWRLRLPFALAGVTLLLALGLLDVPHLVEFAGLDIILFLIGMMIFVGYLEENRFFEYLVDGLVRAVGPRPLLLVITLMIVGALSAALVDEVTSILFMTATMIHLTSRYGISPVPFVILQVFATNIGSSATVVGNPIGVMIAIRAGLTFQDFLRWASPVTAAVLLLAIPLALLYFSGEIRRWGQIIRRGRQQAERSPARKPPQRLAVSLLLFAGTIAGLVLHSTLEGWLGLQKNSLLVGIALAAAAISLALKGERARDLVEHRVDWWTLLFFLALFASVGTLHYAGVTERVARSLVSSIQEPRLLFVTLTWTIGLLSGFLDNVLAVATFVPIVQDIAAAGIDVSAHWWGILFGGTLFGNLTVIGSTANIVAIGMLERRNAGSITFARWLLPGALVSIPTLALATLLLYLQFFR